MYCEGSGFRAYALPQPSTLIQGYLAHEKEQPSPPGPPQDPRYRRTVGSWEGGVSYERGNHVTHIADAAPSTLITERTADDGLIPPATYGVTSGPP